MTQGRERIIRILAALRAKFADGSGCSEAEAVSAMERYASLMEEYNLNETDVHIKEEGIGKQQYQARQTGKVKPHIYYCISSIAMLSQTRCIYNLDTGAVNIYGTQADRDYAEFLLRACHNAIESSWEAYRFSWDYTKLKRQGTHGRHIRDTFRKVVAMRLAERMRELALANMKPINGTSLVVLKHGLINAFVDNEGLHLKKGTSLSIRSNLEGTVNSALEAADRAQLQHQFRDDPTRLLEGAK